jgi:ATP-dependent RNA helicase RhlE
MPFETLGLRAELVSSVKRRDYAAPTPIQAKAIPVILDSRDVLAGAQTGTGKTAAFTLPMLQLLSREDNRGGRLARALVLTPTRELAVQVGDSVKAYGRNLRLRSTVVYGGVAINPQKEKLRRGVDILVATPGRLLDHAGQRTVDLSRVEILVLDEADRMLDMGFIHDIKRIIKLLPVKRQNLLFFATYSDEMKGLADGLLKNPELIEVARRNMAAEFVTQAVHYVGKDNKRRLLTHLIKDGDWRQALVFTRTKHGANKLSKQLEAGGIKATAIHGNKSQAARTKALDDFKKGRVTALVATDVAARGLDIDSLPHVVNYDIPQVPEDYIHRIGRTGRAGSEGVALSLVSREERHLLRNIEKLLKKSVAVRVVEGFEHADTVATDDAQEKRRFSDRRGFSGRAGSENGNNRNRNRKRNSRNGNGKGRGGNGEAQSLDDNNGQRRRRRDFSSKKPRTSRQAKGRSRNHGSR